MMERGESWGEAGERENERGFKPPIYLDAESEITGEKRLISTLPWSGPSGNIVNSELCASQSFCYTRIYDHTQGLNASRHRESEQ